MRDFNRTCSTALVQPHLFNRTCSTALVQPHLFLSARTTGINTKMLWVDTILYMWHSKVLEKPPNTEGGYPFLLKILNINSQQNSTNILKMDALDLFKPLSQIAREYNRSPKTLYNHIKKNERLNSEIKSGLQPPKKQKLIYEEFGYPPEVDKKDYENI